MGRVRSRVAAVVTTVALVASGAGAVATFALLAGAAPAGAATKGTDTVTAYPAPGLARSRRKTHYYRLTATPGQAITQTVHLVNHNKHDIDVRIAGLDGYTSDATGAAYTTPGRVADEDRDVDRRVHARAHDGAGRSSATSTFTLHVPKNAKPGEYLGAIGLWVPLDSSTTTQPGGQQAGFAVTLQGERVIAVEVVVPGPTKASLAVTGVTPSAGPDGLRLQVGIANQGNTFTHGSGVVTVADTQAELPVQDRHVRLAHRDQLPRSVDANGRARQSRREHQAHLRQRPRHHVERHGRDRGLVAAPADEGPCRTTRSGRPRPSSSHSISPLLIVAIVGALACIGGAVLDAPPAPRDPALAG